MDNQRDITEADFPTILRLNDAEVAKTSPLDRLRLRELVQMSSYAVVSTVEDEVAAFLIAMREGAPYDSVNYRWFSMRYQKFLYIDRIVVDARIAHQHMGTMMYDRLFEYARNEDIPQIACEYDIEPLNAASQSFHRKFGFRQVGTQWTQGHTKRVSLQVAEI